MIIIIMKPLTHLPRLSPTGMCAHTIGIDPCLRSLKQPPEARPVSLGPLVF